jgi:hypothetical protein
MAKILIPDSPTPLPEEPAVPQKTDFWGNLGAGSYSAANEGLLGLPDFLVKTFAGETDPNSAYNQLKQLRAEHKLASDIGKGAGLVGSAFIPGGAVVKGLGTAARGAGAVKTGNALLDAAKVLAGGEKGAQGLKAVGQGALQGAGTAAEQGLVRVATGNEEIEDLPGSIALGGVAGGAIKGIASKLLPEGALKGGTGEGGAEYAGNELRELANKAVLSSVGVDTRSLRRAIQQSGLKTALSKTNNAEEYIGDVAQMVRDRGITGKRGFSALLKEAQDDFENVEAGFRKNAPAGWNQALAKTLDDDSELLTEVTEMGVPAAEDYFTKAVKEIATTSNPGAIRNRLGKFARDRMVSQNVDDRAMARVATAIKSKVDDFIADNSGLPPEVLTAAKHKWKVLQPWIQQEAKDATSLNKIFTGGSPTFEKGEINDILTKLSSQSLPGAAIGAGTSATSDLSQGQDINVGNLVMASLAGSLAPKAFAGGANALLSRLGREGSKVLTNEGIMSKAVQLGAKGTEIAAEKAAPLAGKVAASTVKAMDKEPESVQGERKITADLEKTALPEDIESARQEMATEIKPQMMAHLQNIYTRYYYDRDPQAFLQTVLEKTNNFTNPEATAKLLYIGDPEAQRKYIRRYNDKIAVGQLELSQDGKPGKAITESGFGLPFIAGDQFKALRRIMIDNAAEHDVNKVASATKDVDRDLKLVRENPALLDTLLTSPKYGLNFQDLKDVGVV